MAETKTPVETDAEKARKAAEAEAARKAADDAEKAKPAKSKTDGPPAPYPSQADLDVMRSRQLGGDRGLSYKTR